MSETAHTPTPWYVGKKGRTGHRVFATSYGVDGVVCASIENDANAAFICLACNAHDELVAASQTIITWLPLIKQNYPEMISLIHGMERARTVLAKLEKEGS